MKHRTVTGFIVILAALTVAPQALQQVVSLRTAAGNRLTAALWNSFLSLQGRKAPSATRAPEAQTFAKGGEVATPADAAPQTESASCVMASVKSQKPKAASRKPEGAGGVEIASADVRELTELASAGVAFNFAAKPDGGHGVALPRAFVGAPGAAVGKKGAPLKVEVPEANDFQMIFKHLGPLQNPKLKKELTRVVYTQNVAASRTAREEVRRLRDNARALEEWQRVAPPEPPASPEHADFTF